MTEPKPSRKGLWRAFAFVGAGVLLAVAAGLVGRRTEALDRFDLDRRGVRIAGSAEPIGNGFSRLRYSHPSGVVYSRTYRGRVPSAAEEGKTPINLVYDPAKPEEFQPAGVSYVPMAAVILLTTAGLINLIYGNRRLRRVLAPRPDRPPAKSASRKRR